MANEIWEQITPILVTSIMGILVVIIKGVGDILKEYFTAKRDEVVNRIGQEKFDFYLSVGRNIWGIVEEEFRVSEKVGNLVEEKVNIFNMLLLEKFPDLSQSDVDYIRQTIAGQINAYKGFLKEPVYGSEPKE